jgi:predicted metal-binding membrane protein
MIYDARDLARVRNPLLISSVVAWILLLVEPDGLAMLAHCPATISRAVPLTSFRMLLAMNSPATLAGGWALMLVAMMSPVLIPPVSHIRLRTLTRRRTRSIVLFVIGYVAIWITVGGVLLVVELAARVFTPLPYLPVACVALIALVWQFSPIKQRCLNRCHAHPELAPFGGAADFDVLHFGMTHGIWCAASCWALMLFPMLLPRGHIVAMAAVAILIFGERLEEPKPLRWCPRGLGKAIRIVVGLTRMRLYARRLDRAPSHDRFQHSCL